MKREKLETWVAIAALILMALAALGLYAAVHLHQPPAALVLVHDQPSVIHPVAPSKDTGARRPASLPT